MTFAETNEIGGTMRSVNIVLIFCLCCGFLGCDDPPPPPSKATHLGSRLELAAGDVWLTQTDTKKRLITGAMLPHRSTLNVGDGGRALIRLGTGTSVFLRSGTEATIDGDSFSLSKGEIWADIPAGNEKIGRFQAGDVTISAADAGIDIAMDGKGAQTVYVARGLAVVTAPWGRTEVQSGEKVQVKAKEKLHVEPVDFWEDWTGGMADRKLLAGVGGKGAGQLYGIDPHRPGSPPEPLQILSQSVRVLIRDGIAHTVVDQTFFNPTSDPLEGWYWFTVPEDASVERFALEVDGALVNGEMIERKQAREAYEEAVQSAFDPALLEWIDERTFRARIFPLPAAGQRRVVLAYSQLLPLADGVYRYVYPMVSDGKVSIQEFSLSVELGDEGRNYQMSTLQDARVEADKSRISMRRSGFVPKADFLLELKPNEPVPPLRAMRFAASEREADYVLLRYSPQVDWSALKKVPGDVVIVLDTSAGGDPSERQIRSDAAEAILRALSPTDRFAIVAADLKPQVVYPAKGLIAANEKNVSAGVEALSLVPSAGATDLGAMFSVALDLLHDAEQPALVYIGDGRPTVGETDSTALNERLRRALGDSKARLFTLAVGAEADHFLLSRLARTGGGRSFRISTSEQTVGEALRFVGMLKTPTITDLKIDAGSGLDQVFTTAAGKVSEGDEVILMARTHHDLPEKIKITGQLGQTAINESYDVNVSEGPRYGYIPILWAREYLNRLMGEGTDQMRGRIISLGLTYSLMTPFSSFLVLESEDAYLRQGIIRRQRHGFSSLTREEAQVQLAKAKEAVGFPLLLFGCSSSDEMEEAPMMASEMQLEKKALPPVAPAAQPEGNFAAASGSAPSPSPQSPARGERAPAESVVKQKARKMEAKRRTEQVDMLGGMGGGGEQGEPLAELSYDKDDERDMGKGQIIPTTNPYDTGTEDRSIFKKGICSDASRRSLAERRILWRARLSQVRDPHDLGRLFFEAGERCELPRWKARRVLLDMIEQQASSPESVRSLLEAFASFPQLQNYLRNRILRRTLDPDTTMGIHFPGSLDWSSIVAGLQALKDPNQQLAQLREILQKYPQDPIGRGHLVALLVKLDRKKEALAEAERLRREGLMSPHVLQILCDLQAEMGQVEQAKRTCSELVEFNEDDPRAREQLGDLFLRHGWYEAAYRQYLSLAAMLDDQPLSLLKLAAAAAGMGKIDEALRIERKVASGDGEPGVGDPRRIARLHSAAKLAIMLRQALDAADKEKAQVLERSLKRTQIFNGSSTIAILIWEDFDASLDFVTPNLSGIEKTQKAPHISEHVVSSQSGLAMLDLGATAGNDMPLRVELKTEDLGRDVPYLLCLLTWDGKQFTVSIEENRVQTSSNS